jgi:hypothetical protein
MNTVVSQHQKNLSDAYKAILPILHAPWHEQVSLFRESFSGDIFLLSARTNCGNTREIAAICSDEITPLKTWLAKITALHEHEVVASHITLEKLCEEKDPRNGNAQEGTENDIFIALISRLNHLKVQDLENVTEWAWQDGKPYPLNCQR